MNVFSSLRADEDIGPYQLLCPQLCDITNCLAEIAMSEKDNPVRHGATHGRLWYNIRIVKNCARD